MNEIIRLSLREIAIRLQVKDVRTARKWCVRQNVALLSDAGTKSLYVIKSEFEAALLNSLVSYLKTRYGAEWQKALSIYQSGDIGGLLCITQEKGNCCIPSRGNKNFPGPEAARFFSELMATVSGL